MSDSEERNRPHLDAMDSIRLRRSVYGLLIVTAVAVSGASILQAKPLQGANDRSRWCTVWSLVERGTYRIDEVDRDKRWKSIDKVRSEGPLLFSFESRDRIDVAVNGELHDRFLEHGMELSGDTVLMPAPRADGKWLLADKTVNREFALVQRTDRVDVYERHFYSSKPPLLSTLMAGGYWIVKRVTPWRLYTRAGADARVTRLLLVVTNLLPMAVSLVLIAVLAERHAQTDWTRLFLVSAAAFGTLLSPFLSTFNNHTVAAFSIVFSIYPAMRILCDGQRSLRLYFLAGFWAGFASSMELPAALFGAAICVLLARNTIVTSPKQFVGAACAFAGAALIPITGFLVTNYLATGGWKPFYMSYGTDKYLYEGSYWWNPKGLDRAGETPLTYFWHCTLGHHGILSLSPIFVLTLVGWLTVRRWCREELRTIVWLGVLLTVSVLAFYLSRTANYNYGGKSVALRWMLWLVPLWLLGMIPALDRLAHCRWFRVTAGVLLLVSVFSAWYPAGNPWQHPWLFELLDHAGWISYAR